ncbi:breast cancer metastasis-suppressor 1-like protein-A [Anneissia japonica]|uniref:breast cancer metastasis-suppressor 1-like protein-A n=1 Tax=Anneissia japonica TaxID=1529436 RepID=UPI00142573FE|nr:breast cancer metastasis-suppressor 1-like protein-A [Anneissia japonica]
MDEEECDKRRTECFDDMTDLEMQFSDLKEILYHERLSQVDSKLAEVQKGYAIEYLKPLKELEEHTQMTLHICGILRKLKLKNIENAYECEGKAALEHYESEKILLKDAFRADLEEKIRKLEEDRHNIDISAELWNESQKKHQRKSDSLHPDKKKKPVAVSGPFIVYMLKEFEILEDWTAIMKARGISSRRKSDHVYHSEGHRHPYSARYEDGRLYYEGTWFSRSSRVVIEKRDDPPVHGIITSINTSEIWLKLPDGTKSKLYLSNLQKGRYTIKHHT